MKICIIPLAMALALTIASQAQTTIYADGFNRTGNLHTSPPDTTLGSYGGTAGATWTAGGITLTTGTDASVGGTAMGYLPFVPQNGRVYTVTVHADLTGDWAGIGFTSTAAPSLTANLNNCESGGVGAPAWILYQNNVATVRVGGSSVASSSAGGSGYNTITLVLNTTGAQWTLQGSMNGNLTSVHTYSTNPTINTVAISGAYGGGGMKADSFSLTVNVASSIATTTTLASSANPSNLGQGVTFTATITSGTGSTNPTGTVQFKVDGSDFGAPVSVTNGTGLTGTATSSSTSSLGAGPHSIVAVYSGDGTYLTSTSEALTQTVRTAYETWTAGSFANAFIDIDPTDDPDGDGLSNQQEFAFGLDPTSGASVNPITDISTLQSAGIFSYTRYATSGLTYTIWTSPDLQNWTKNDDAIQSEGPITNGMQTVEVELNPAPSGSKFFVRVQTSP